MSTALRARVRTLATLVALTFAATQCGAPDPTEPDDEKESTLTISADVTPAVVGITVEIDAEDIDPPIVQNIPVVDLVATGTVTCPAGSDRTITVRAFDAGAIETHRGSETVDVRSGVNVMLTIALRPLRGDQPIDVTMSTYAVTIDPAEASIDALDTVQFTATVSDAGGPVVDPELYWGSGNPVIADVDDAGLVTGRHAGQTLITANYLGAVAQATVIVAGAVTERILFVSNRDGNNEIYSMAPDGSDVVRLTTDAPGEEESDGSPRWSPDGGRILYTRGATRDLWVMNADGTGKANITSSPSVSDYEAEWSPDGTQVVFLAYAAVEWEVYVVNADGSGLQNISNDPDAADYQPNWSSGGRIAFATDRDIDWEIYTVDPDGSDLANFTNAGGDDNYPSWSPDGTRIAWRRTGAGGYDLLWMAADGGSSGGLADVGVYRRPKWSPDGTRIAYDGLGDGRTHVYVWTLGGGNSQLTDGASISDGSIVWSPDGSRLAFTRRTDADHDYEIWVINADGTGLTQLTSTDRQSFLADWGRVAVFDAAPAPGSGGGGQ